MIDLQMVTALSHRSGVFEVTGSKGAISIPSTGTAPALAFDTAATASTLEWSRNSRWPTRLSWKPTYSRKSKSFTANGSCAGSWYAIASYLLSQNGSFGSHEKGVNDASECGESHR
jgi:hypothetical protein